MDEQVDAVTALSLARNLLAELDRRSPGLTLAVKRRMERQQRELAKSTSEHERTEARLLGDGLRDMGWAELTTSAPQSRLDL